MRFRTERGRADREVAGNKNFFKRFLGEVRGYGEAFLVAFLVVTFLFNTVGVVGASMQPTLDGGSGTLAASLLQGDRVFIPKYESWLRRLGVMGPYRPGDVVVVREPANSPTAQLPGRQECLQDLVGIPCRPFLIKRIVAGPGDRLMVAEGVVYLNGRPLDSEHLEPLGESPIEKQNFPMISQVAGDVTGLSVEFGASPQGLVFPILPTNEVVTPVYPADNPYVQYYFGAVLDNLAPIPDDAPVDQPFLHELVVPQDHYFVMGDNRTPNGSEDSRLFGFVPAITVAGRASHVIWPPRRDGEWNWRRLEPPATFSAVW